MLAPTQKPAAAPLVHHPTTALDDLCAFTLANAAWAAFDEQLSQQVATFEEQHRDYWTPNPKAVRQSLGR